MSGRPSILLAAVAGAGLALAWLLQRRLLYFPAPADRAAAELGAVRVHAAARAVQDGDGHATVRTDDGPVQARWVLDSRPARPRRPATTPLLQHFRGWAVHFGADVLDPVAQILVGHLRSFVRANAKASLYWRMSFSENRFPLFRDMR